MPTTQNTAAQASTASIFMMPGLFNETLHLLLEARQYFESDGRSYEATLGHWHRHQFATEMARITLRLSCVMAWLTVQKAVCSGRMSQEEARMMYPLDGQSICLESNVAAESVLPGEMNYLLEESLTLYERVHRLERQAASSLH